MNRTHRPLAVFLVAFAGVLWAFQPLYAQPPSHQHDVQDIQIVPPHLPELAETEEVNRWSERIDQTAFEAERAQASEATGYLLSELRAVREADLPDVARERLLSEIAAALSRRGTADCLPELRALAAQEPQAVYLAPGCRLLRPHAYYEFNLAARRAIDQVNYREARSAALQLSPEDRAQAIREALRVESDAARLLGTLDGLAAGNDDVQATWSELLREDPELLEGLSPSLARALILHHGEQGNATILYETSRSDIQPAARLAVIELGALRQRDGVVSVSSDQLLDLCDAPGGLVGSLALAQLSSKDASVEVLDRLEGFLGDPELGTDAALTLLRIAPQEAEAMARRVLTDPVASASRMRRAVVILMQAGTPSARESLIEFTKSDMEDQKTGTLKREVAQWLAG